MRVEPINRTIYSHCDAFFIDTIKENSHACCCQVCSTARHTGTHIPHIGTVGIRCVVESKFLQDIATVVVVTILVTAKPNEALFKLLYTILYFQ